MTLPWLASVLWTGSHPNLRQRLPRNRGWICYHPWRWYRLRWPGHHLKRFWRTLTRVHCRFVKTVGVVASVSPVTFAVIVHCVISVTFAKTVRTIQSPRSHFPCHMIPFPSEYTIYWVSDLTSWSTWFGSKLTKTVLFAFYALKGYFWLRFL